MAYLEPGVYSKTTSTLPNTGTGAPELVPLVIGSGATVMKATEVITRSADSYDVLPTSAVEIISIGYTSKKADFTVTTDYVLDSVDKTKIVWNKVLDPVEHSTAIAPAEGESYTVIYSYAVGEEQYTPQLITGDSSQIIDFYGDDIQIDGTVNNISTAAQLMMAIGCSKLYMLQVKPASGTTVTATDYQLALDEYAQFLEKAWRIVPVDLGNDINAAIDGHITKCSSYEERKERCGVYSFATAHSITTGAEVITQVGGYAASKANERISVVYPASASKTMSDGSLKVLTGQFIAAAYAALEAVKPLYQSKTRSTFAVFDELLGVQLTRAQKNALAEKGVMIFEQPNGAGTNVICRHQLTTNMDSAEYRENSILSIKDYTSKYLRQVLETYIGKYNITVDTITKVKGSINAIFSALMYDGFLIDGSIEEIAQDEANPDTLFVTVKINVPYPCNYIKLTIIVD